MTQSNEAEYKTKTDKELVKYLISANNRHLFNIDGTTVKVVFSTKKDAPTIESALVKIASNRGK